MIETYSTKDFIQRQLEGLTKFPVRMEWDIENETNTLFVTTPKGEFQLSRQVISFDEVVTFLENHNDD